MAATCDTSPEPIPFISRRTLTTGLASLAAFCTFRSTQPFAQAAACRFSGNPIIELLTDGRNARLFQRFEFVDGKGRGWPVPKDIIVDGASIPRTAKQLGWDHALSSAA
jgi:hypothetical protein